MESEERVFRKVKAALSAFFRSENALLDINASERSISHKLAEHLQEQFPALKADCEYNRHGKSIKRLKYQYSESITADDLEAKTVYPDIVIHQRGDDESNLLVIEIKKSNSRQDHSKDEGKLKAFTGRQYGYRVGLFLLFDIEKKRLSAVRCFKAGEEVEGTVWSSLQTMQCGK